MSADPLTLFMIASAASSVIGGVSARSAGKANAAVNQYNAAVLRRDADIKEQAAKSEAELLRERGQKVIATAGTKYLKSGVEVAGSPVEVLGSMAADLKLDELNVLYKGELESLALENQARGQEYQARLAIQQGDQAFKAGLFSAGVSLVGAGFAQFGAASTATVKTTSTAAQSGTLKSLSGPGTLTPYGGVRFGTGGSNLPYGMLGV